MAKLSKLSRNKRTERQKTRRSEQLTRTQGNRSRKLKKHLRSHPDDQQAAAALA